MFVGTILVKAHTGFGGSNGASFSGLPWSWYFAEGSCRPGFDPYLCVKNPSAVDADVRITYMTGDGSVEEQTLKVGAASRLTVAVKEFLGEGDDPAHDFSARVEATNGVEIVVERPMYFNYRGLTGGHCVSGFSRQGSG